MTLKLFQVKNYVTVEPTFFLYTAVYIVMQSTLTNLMLQKECRHNSTSEPNLDTLCDDEKKGALFATEINSLTRLVMFSCCGIFSILAMSWSDIAGRRRRILILLPSIGLIFQALSGCFHSYFWSWSPILAAVTNTLIEAMSGSVVLMTLISQMYLCDVVDIESRTMRIGILTASRTLGDLLGYGSAGFILYGLGFFYTYVVCFALSLVSLTLTLIFVKDISIPVDKKPHFLQFFNVTRVFESFKVVFNKGLAHNRITVSILCVIFALVYFTTQGSLFCSIVLSKILKIHDGLIGVFAGIWDTFAVIGFLLATQNWHVYLIPLLDIFHGTVFSVGISFFSKFYKQDELGHLSSVLSVFGLIIPVCLPTYNAIYQLTVDVFPSAYFLLSMVLDIGIVVLFWTTYILSKKINKQKVTVDPSIQKQYES